MADVILTHITEKFTEALSIKRITKTFGRSSTQHQRRLHGTEAFSMIITLLPTRSISEATLQASYRYHMNQLLINKNTHLAISNFPSCKSHLPTTKRLI
ncbi:hypothetical protein O181_013468 [Austropuccinia psidii MF-1]|uniref:Uncharacterized protein n=1 Tax=Austropuccinia psidii MF-1 TaxID=1389203 RepID=A0A9Q3GN52_9BASI|nr:hypothetical protein [Austropuccinia psidii MF-1]